MIVKHFEAVSISHSISWNDVSFDDKRYADLNWEEFPHKTEHSSLPELHGNQSFQFKKREKKKLFNFYSHTEFLEKKFTLRSIIN